MKPDVAALIVRYADLVAAEQCRAAWRHRPKRPERCGHKRPVIASTGERWQSRTEAAARLGVTQAAVSTAIGRGYCCRGLILADASAA